MCGPSFAPAAYSIRSTTEQRPSSMPRVGVRRVNEDRVGLPNEVDIRDVTPAPGQKARILLAGHRLSDPEAHGPSPLAWQNAADPGFSFREAVLTMQIQEAARANRKFFAGLRAGAAALPRAS